MIDLNNLKVKELHDSYKRKEFTISEIVGSYLNEIKKSNKDINAYLEIFSDIDEQIKKAEEKFEDGSDTLMTGIPIAIKDNILFEDHLVSASSKILEDYKATYDSFVVKKLKEAGAIIIGRTNMDEFAMGSSTQTSAFGVTKNPVDITRVPGGSSGGSAAAVAANMALLALGTETCGSVRQPASFCGLVGIKPTYGAVSRHGIIAMGSSLDQVGAMGKNVEDVKVIFDTINGFDKKDSTSIPEKLRTNKIISKKKKLGVPREFLKGEGIDEEVLKNFDESCEKLKKAGYEIVDIDLPLLKYSLAVYYIIMPAEVSSNLARYDGIRYGLSQKADTLYDVYANTRNKGFGKEVRRRILLGTYILSHGYYDAYYNTAIKVRNAISKNLHEAFKDIDGFLTPTVPTPPFKLGEKMDDPVTMYLNDIFSAPANLAGIPAITLPSGKTKEGLPLGIQITADYLQENILFEIGKDFEKLV